MKAYLEELSSGLAEQYKLYLETFIVDLTCDEAFIELRVAFALRCDHVLRSETFKVEASAALDDVERRAVVAALFLEIEDHIDGAIAAREVTN